MIDGECLRLSGVRVPAYKLKGETAVLECLYELDGLEKLYTVKWYRENEEFYRYVPKYKPPQISYKVEGIRVDVSPQHIMYKTATHVFLNTTCAPQHTMYSSAHQVLSTAHHVHSNTLLILSTTILRPSNVVIFLYHTNDGKSPQYASYPLNYTNLQELLTNN